MDREESSSNTTVVSSLSSSVESLELDAHSASAGLPLTYFTELVDDVTLHFQIIRLAKQIYAWIGCNSAKLGRLYAAVPTPPATAEKKVIEKLISLGYIRPKPRG